MYNKLIFFLIFILLFILGIHFFIIKETYYNGEIYIRKGDNINIFINKLDYWNQLSWKLYLKLHQEQKLSFKPGIYIFTGEYPKDQIIQRFQQGPNEKYFKITILEGWSKYDIDNYLFQKNYIQSGDYIKYTDNYTAHININNYEFISDIIKDNNNKLISLEGFLYPDTYYIDYENDFLTQLFKLQLKRFQKFWGENKQEFEYFNKKLHTNGYNFKLNYYELIILASIIEKEEKNSINKPIIASIFLNRLNSNMRLDADITLCYGLNITYNKCTPNIIIKNLTNKENLYNSRENINLTPTPIANPSQNTIQAVLNFVPNKYYYYLHDNQGNFYPSLNYEDHKIKKSKYVNYK